MKKFNLVQILPSLKSGGVEQGTIDVANYLAKKEIKNCIISNGGNMIDNLNKKFVNHYKLPVHSKIFFLMPFVAKEINKIIEKNYINILHVRSRAPAWLLPYINSKNLKTVSTFHNIYGHENYIKKIYNKKLSKVDSIVAISKYVKEEIIKIYKINENKITIIDRGIDTNFFNGKIDNQNLFIKFLNDYNINLDKKIILYPGRITEWKGQIEFLNIVEQFKDEPYVFYFVGDNKNTSYYKKFLYQIKIKNISNICRVLNHLDKQDLKMMYKCCNLIISAPLKPEGFGRIVSEGLAMEKIVLGYNYGGVKNQLNKLDDLYKINPLDNDELKKRIKFILDSPLNKFSNLSIKGRNHIIKNYSKNLMLSNYYNFYEKILL